ncbi:MAG: zf-HC2 domain-containing protein [Planctomycetaceae bacterium]|nr:zf-HC2 domain-containing protein [Planctomycetaceae bacterium]
MLVRFVSNQLSEEESQEIDRHLEGCGRCGEIAANVDDGLVLASVREEFRYSRDEHLIRVMDSVKNLPLVSSTIEAKNDETLIGQHRAGDSPPVAAEYDFLSAA